MTHEVTYVRKEMQPIKVAFPSPDGCPFILQSSYAYGARARIEMCSSVNHAVYDTYCALVGAHPSTFTKASSLAHVVASDLINELLHCMGFERVSSKQI